MFVQPWAVHLVPTESSAEDHNGVVIVKKKRLNDLKLVAFRESTADLVFME